MSYFSVIGRQRKLPEWENQMVLDVARTNVKRVCVGDGGEGKELEKKNIPAIFDFFPPLMSVSSHWKKTVLIWEIRSKVWSIYDKLFAEPVKKWCGSGVLYYTLNSLCPFLYHKATFELVERTLYPQYFC